MKPATDVIVIGAGICGLFAARELLNKGKNVTVIEAYAKPGGRIREDNNHFSHKMDRGAEFIHGDLPLTKSLVRKAGGEAKEKEGRFYHLEKEKLVADEEPLEGLDRVIDTMWSLENDMNLFAFLSLYFNNEEDREVRNIVIRLAEGFDAADPERLSVFALRNEWSGGSLDKAYLIEGGYSLLVKYLSEECTRKGCLIHLSTIAKELHWEKGHVRIISTDHQQFEASQVLITVSLGMLLSEAGEKGHISFIPEIPEKIAAAGQMGYGPVIKANMEFRSAFWNNPALSEHSAQISDAGFIMLESEFPVWWTQNPDEPFITGWAGGRKAENMITLKDQDLLDRALSSLARAFHTTEDFLKEQLVTYSITNWGTEPFAKGAYSYETPETALAKEILSEPLEQTLYFAGEALGDQMGTVESALKSADETVKKILEVK